MRAPDTSESGHATVWLLVWAALIVAAVSSLAFLDDEPQNSTAHLVFAVSFAVALLGMLFEAKRDLFEFCGFAAVVTPLAAVTTGGIALFGFTPHPVAGAFAILMTLVAIAAFVYRHKTQNFEEVLPNILRRDFSATTVYETNGIHFIYRQSESVLAAGGGLVVEVAAQNCWDKERTLVFRLKKESRLSFNRAGLKFSAVTSMVIPPAAVAVLTIPIVSEAKAKGKYTLAVSAEASGSEGTRVRRRRGKRLASEVNLWGLLLGVVGLLFVSGLSSETRHVVEVTVHRKKDIVPVMDPTMLPTVDVVWRPEPAALDAALRAAA